MVSNCSVLLECSRNSDIKEILHLFVLIQLPNPIDRRNRNSRIKLCPIRNDDILEPIFSILATYKLHAKLIKSAINTN